MKEAVDTIVYCAFFFFSEQRSKTVAPMPMKARARAPDIKMLLFKILFILLISLFPNSY